jgi:hypothetical protein
MVFLCPPSIVHVIDSGMLAIRRLCVFLCWLFNLTALAPPRGSYTTQLQILGVYTRQLPVLLEPKQRKVALPYTAPVIPPSAKNYTISSLTHLLTSDPAVTGTRD